MLKLDSLTAFTGVIDNFTGNGSLSGSDQIDLKGINFNSVHDSYSNGILTVTDGTNTTTLDFNGTYVLANFDFASDGSGGTIVYDPPVPAQPQSPSAVGHTASSKPQASSLAPARIRSSSRRLRVITPRRAGLRRWTRDKQPRGLLECGRFLVRQPRGTHGHAFMADSAHDAMAVQPLTESQFHAHFGGFHIV